MIEWLLKFAGWEQDHDGHWLAPIIEPFKPPTPEQIAMFRQYTREINREFVRANKFTPYMKD